jgi:hypothetical protein
MNAPTDHQPTRDPLPGRTRLAVQVLGAFIAPVAAGLALGVAVVIGAEVPFSGHSTCHKAQTPAWPSCSCWP